MTSDDTAQAPADLAIEVYTTPGRPFASAATPEGPGDPTTAGIVTRMAERYPDWENLRTLWHSARAAIARKNNQLAA